MTSLAQWLWINSKNGKGSWSHCFYPLTGLSLPVISEHVELVKRTMAGVSLPAPGVPAWAREISDAQWEDVVQKALQARQASPAWK